MAIYPDASSWITARTSSAKITTDNCQIVLNQKIEKINKVLVNGDSVIIPLVTIVTPSGVHNVRNVKYSQLSTTQSWEGQLKEIDITDFVLEEAKYQTLPLTQTSSATPVKNNTWYYSHNADRIIIVNDDVRGWQLQTSVAASLIVAAAGRGNALYLFYEGTWYSITYNSAVDISQSLLSWQFRVYYTPLGESVNLQVTKTNPQPNRFNIPFSQQQPIVDNLTHGRQMQSIANRTGCEKKEGVRTLHSIGELRKLGTVYRERDASGKLTGNIWRLTGQRYEIWSETFVRVVETWSKNWSYRSENVPINREFRSWKIPADIVQRNLKRDDYCLLTRKNVTLPDDAWISEDAKAALMRGLTGVAQGGITECNNLWFYVEQQQEGGVTVKTGAILSCSAFGFGNSLVFSGKTKDNLSAGVQRIKSDDGDSNYQFCKDVYYCKENGKLDTLWLQIGSQVRSSFNDSVYDYPAYAETEQTGGVLYINAPDPQGSLLFKDETKLKVLKDPCEQLNFTYQLHLLTDDGYLVIGSTWASTNPLVKQRDADQTIKVWKLTQCVPQGAQIMTPTYGTVLQSNLFSVVDSGDNGASVTFNGAANDGVGVCVTDAQNNVLIAFNSTETATFNVLFTHSYEAIAKALKAS